MGGVGGGKVRYTSHHVQESSRETESLTIFGVDDLVRGVEASVHVGGVGGEGHGHLVGFAGFR